MGISTLMSDLSGGLMSVVGSRRGLSFLIFMKSRDLNIKIANQSDLNADLIH